MRRTLPLLALLLLLPAGPAPAQNPEGLVLDTRGKAVAFWLMPQPERDRLQKAAELVSAGRVEAAGYDDLVLIGRYSHLLDPRRVAPFLPAIDEETGFADLARLSRIRPEVLAQARREFCSIRDVMKRRVILLTARKLAELQPHQWAGQVSPETVFSHPLLFGIEPTP